MPKGVLGVQRAGFEPDPSSACEMTLHETISSSSTYCEGAVLCRGLKGARGVVGCVASLAAANPRLNLSPPGVCANRFRLGRFKSEICIVNKCLQLIVRRFEL